MLPRIPSPLLDLYGPLSPWESFYLRTRWRLYPFELLESLLPHHVRDDRLEVLLRKTHACLVRGGILAVPDVETTPFWKFCVTYSIDRLLNLTDRLWYRPVPSMLALLKRSGFQVEEVIRADRDLPLADVLVLCRRDTL